MRRNTKTMYEWRKAYSAAEDKDIENYIAEHTLLETDAGTLKQ